MVAAYWFPVVVSDTPTTEPAAGVAPPQGQACYALVSGDARLEIGGGFDRPEVATLWSLVRGPQVGGRP
jgi:hypothetical protein